MSDTTTKPPVPPTDEKDKRESGGDMSLVTSISEYIGTTRKFKLTWLQKPLSGEEEKRWRYWLTEGMRSVRYDGIYFHSVNLSIDFEEGYRTEVFLQAWEKKGVLETLSNKGWDITGFRKYDSAVDDNYALEKWRDLWIELSDNLSEQTLRKIFLDNFKTGIPDTAWTSKFLMSETKLKILNEALEKRRKLDREAKKVAKKNNE